METLPDFENKEQLPVVEFQYDKDRDIKCLLEKGPGGYFSPYPTRAYKALIAQTGENPTPEGASEFIDIYLKQNGLILSEIVGRCNTESKKILEHFKRRSEEIFGIKIPEGTKAYLTVNNRCPYDIEENMFYATISENTSSTLSISLHELWHFYTWYRFGEREQESGTFDRKKYGDMKEALTVLLNPECLDLLPEGEIDKGYPQHRELREQIVQLWREDPDIEFIWETIKR